jgi:hypothetical protein
MCHKENLTSRILPKGITIIKHVTERLEINISQ